MLQLVILVSIITDNPAHVSLTKVLPRTTRLSYRIIRQFSARPTPDEECVPMHVDSQFVSHRVGGAKKTDCANCDAQLRGSYVTHRFRRCAFPTRAVQSTRVCPPDDIGCSAGRMAPCR